LEDRVSEDRVSSNKQVLSHLRDALNSRDEERISATIDEVFDPDAQVWSAARGVSRGAAALKQIWATLLHAYPDLHVAAEDIVGEGDLVAVRNTVTGTHQGEHLGKAPTGASVRYAEVFFLRFANGRIIETWGLVDLLSQMKQLGAVPA
jgi:predicted ester cyclase